jgi:hypothetical protein
MTVETEGVSEVVEQVQTPEQAAQAFAAGFEDDEDKQTPTPAAEATQTAAEDKKDESPQPAPKYAQITEDQLNELMAKASQFDESRRQIDTLAGHIGGVKQVVESLKQQRKSLSAGQLKRVAAEFPELAEALQSDLSELGGASVDPMEIDKRVESVVESRVAAKAIEFETKLLRFYHRDWDKVAVSQDFLTWKNQLPEAERTKLDNSNDGEYIADKLTEFKAAKAAKDKADAEAAARAKSSDKRQQRLEAAVPPRGSGGHTPSKSGVPSDFQAGWDSA